MKLKLEIQVGDKELYALIRSVEACNEKDLTGKLDAAIDSFKEKISLTIGERLKQKLTDLIIEANK